MNIYIRCEVSILTNKKQDGQLIIRQHSIYTRLEDKNDTPRFGLNIT